MKLTLTYTDLIAAATHHLKQMGVTGEITGVELKAARKDVTQSSMTVYVGEAAPVKAAPAAKEVKAAHKPASEENVEEAAPVAAEEPSEVEEAPQAAPRPSGLFGSAAAK